MSAIEQVTSSMAAVSLSNGRRDSKVIMLCRDRKDADVLLVCRDGTEIYMDNDTALMSKYLNQIIFLFRRCYGNGSDNDRVKVDLSKLDELANIPSYLVEKVFRYCNRHAHSQSHRDLAALDAQFYNNISYSEFCKLHKVPYYISIYFKILFDYSLLLIINYYFFSPFVFLDCDEVRNQMPGDVGDCCLQEHYRRMSRLPLC